MAKQLLGFGTAWAPMDYCWTAHSYMSNAKDLLIQRGQTKQADEVADLMMRLVKLADGLSELEEYKQEDAIHDQHLLEEETQAEHELDVDCIRNAGCN